MRSGERLSPAFQIERDQTDVLRTLITGCLEACCAASLLDIGAGDGRLAASLAPLVSSYLAIESNSARAGRLRDAGLDVLEGRFPEDPRLEGAFDFVLASHSLPDSEVDYGRFLSCAWERVKRDGGCLLLVTFIGTSSGSRDLARRLGLQVDDGQKLAELHRILAGLGSLTSWEVVSQSWCTDLDEMTAALLSTMASTDDEQERFRKPLREALHRDYRQGDRYVLDHGHRVMAVRAANA